MRHLYLLLISALMSAAPAVSGDTLEQAIHARLALMKDVAHAKWLTQRPIEDLDREQVVIEQAVLSGLRYRLKPAATTQFFTAQIEAAKAIQNYWFEVWQNAPPGREAPDLAADIRPRLLALGDEILARLGEQPIISQKAHFIAQTSLEGLPRDHQIALFQALQSLDSYRSPLQQITESQILRVGTTFDYAPFSYRDAAGNPQGFDIALAEQLAASLGARIHWVETTWPTLMQDFTEGRFDIGMSGISIIPARSELAHFSQAYHSGGKTPIARCDNEADLTSLARIDRPEISVIVNPGGTNERFVRGNIKSAQITVHPSNRTIFDALLEGQADVMITDAIEVAVMTARYSALCATMPGQRLSRQEKGILMPRSDELRAQINHFLEPRLKDDSIHQLMQSAIKLAAQTEGQD